VPRELKLPVDIWGNGVTTAGAVLGLEMQKERLSARVWEGNFSAIRRHGGPCALASVAVTKDRSSLEHVD
jgi:hypothetical protein